MHYKNSSGDEIANVNFNFRLLANQWAERRLVMHWCRGCRAMKRRAWNAGASNARRSLCVHISRERSYPPIESQLTALQLCRWYNEICCRLFVLCCGNCPKDDKFRYFIPHFEEVRGGVEPWSMSIARWKARVEFLLSVIELLFLSIVDEALQGKICKNSLPSGGGRSIGAKILWGRRIFFGFYKTRRHILLSDSANCTVLSALVLI